MWLGTDGLVEILYRKYIVFIIKRTAPYRHQSVGIELGHTDQRHIHCYDENNLSIHEKTISPLHRSLGLISAAITALKERAEFVLYKLLTQR